MTRALRLVGSDDPQGVFEAVRAALSEGGPAVVPRDPAVPGRFASEENEGTSAEIVAQNVALVIETSGSTGTPKRVALSADALLASAAASASALGGQGQWLLALPTHYVAGAQVLVRSLAAQTEPVIMPAGHFDPAVFAENARQMTGDGRFVSLVPVQLARLLDAAESDPGILAVLRRFDGVLIGGQALAPSLRERADAAGMTVTVTYGSSETAGGCVYDGVPIGNTIARTVDGVVELAGAVLAEGYVGDPRRTAESFHDDAGHRWYKTGDLGRAEDGRVVIEGRADNVIISGGEKIQLDAVERVVRSIRGYEHAVVVSSPSDEWGQVVVVVLEGLSPLALPELRSLVAAARGRAAAPAAVVEVAELPMLTSGKPDRVAAARLAAARERS